jgi:hypothetical protein
VMLSGSTAFATAYIFILHVRSLHLLSHKSQQLCLSTSSDGLYVFMKDMRESFETIDDLYLSTEENAHHQNHHYQQYIPSSYIVGSCCMESESRKRKRQPPPNSGGDGKVEERPLGRHYKPSPPDVICARGKEAQNHVS